MGAESIPWGQFASLLLPHVLIWDISLRFPGGVPLLLSTFLFLIIVIILANIGIFPCQTLS